MVLGALVAAPAAAPAAADAQAPAAATPATTTAASASISVASNHDVLVGQRVIAHGFDHTAKPGTKVRIEARQHGAWHVVATTQTGANGAFRASWRPHRLGHFALRAVDTATGTVTAAATRTSIVTVYRPVSVSWYGPGFWGGALACGGTLQPGQLGVANKTLPCGTRVTLRYNGRRVTVPVIDRGPYVAGREYDLTAATKDKLGAPDTGIVWSSR